jgi:hypothetical protein
MGKKLIRQPLMVNQRRGIRQEFDFHTNLGFKSKATPSVFSWGSRGRGVEGESTNSTNNAANQIINKNWRPI